jgi:membrane fusion protein, multidrug efflux system
MKAFTEKLLHYLSMIGVTLFALWVMWSMMAKNDVPNRHHETIRPLAPIAVNKSPVVVEPVTVELCEVHATYAGKIHPWETHRVRFEIPGRIFELGKNADGRPLDDGDTVQTGQVLATIDSRVYRALGSEAAARVEQATSDLKRAQSIRATSPAALSDSELQALATELALTRAQHDVAKKNLQDTILVAPTDATISRRYVNAGESVDKNQIAFELIENEQVLLIVEVPESQVREMETRLRDVRTRRSQNSPSFAARPASLTAVTAANAQEKSVQAPKAMDDTFRAYVDLVGKDRLGNAWPSLVGEVHRIAEVADPRTGLFEVEIQLPNQDGLLRPGMVATARIVTAQIPGYRIPDMSVIHRNRQAYLFSIEEQAAEMEVLYWNFGNTVVHRAKRIQLQSWIEQGPSTIIPVDQIRAHGSSTPAQDQLKWIVTRGQHRLAENQLVRIVEPQNEGPSRNQGAAR